GVVHEDRGRAEAPERLGEEALDLLLARHVDAQDDRAAAGVEHEALGLAGAVLVRVAGDGDVGALARELDGDGLADARVGAGDDRGLLAGPLRHRSPTVRAAADRTRPSRGLATRVGAAGRGRRTLAAPGERGLGR